MKKPTYKSYAEKLKDQRWQKKRLELLEAAGWKCQHEVCNHVDEKPTLHVHHKIYLKSIDPWDYDDWAYLVLCESCHEYFQDKMQDSAITLAKNQNLMLALAAWREFDPIEVSKISNALYETRLSLPPQFKFIADILSGVVGGMSESFFQGYLFKKNEE